MLYLFSQYIENKQRMKKLKFISNVLIIISVFIPFNFAQAQIIISSGEEVTAEDLVESILEEGVQYFNVLYQGADVAKGTFTNGFSTNLGIDQGIILTSGCASNLEGPNYNTGASCANGTGGDWILGWENTFDACVLDFDIIPESDTLKLRYVFGSEEYPEYVLNLYNDLFGIFISGSNPDGEEYMNKNIAIVPGSNPELPVSIGTINNVMPSYEEFYVDNTNGMTIEYDGFTTVLTAWAKVVPCEVYHLHLSVADAGDGILDSGVCLEENSIQFPGIEVENASNIPGYPGIIEGCSGAEIVFRLPNTSFAPATINFEIVNGPGFAHTPEDYGDENGDVIQPFVIFEEGQDSVSIHIVAWLDNILEGDEMIQFIIENTLGCEIRYDTVTYMITDYNSMVDIISPPTVICQGQEIDLWVNVASGFPPYTYLWEPGGSTNDTITVSPEEPGEYTYKVTIHDMCLDTIMDSTIVTVFPVCELETFYFEAYLNPGLPFDVFGEVMNDSVFVVFPPGTNLNGLIPSYTFENEDCIDSVGSINDFTNPVVYVIYGPGGCASEWTVIAEVEVGQNELSQKEIQIFPNPAKEQLNILYANGFKVSLVSNMGIEVYTNTIKNRKQIIDINHLEPGIYYLKFENKDEEFVRKVVIEKE